MLHGTPNKGRFIRSLLLEGRFCWEGGTQLFESAPFSACKGKPKPPACSNHRVAKNIFSGLLPFAEMNMCYFPLSVGFKGSLSLLDVFSRARIRKWNVTVGYRAPCSLEQTNDQAMERDSRSAGLQKNHRGDRGDGHLVASDRHFGGGGGGAFRLGSERGYRRLGPKGTNGSGFRHEASRVFHIFWCAKKAPPNLQADVGWMILL